MHCGIDIHILNTVVVAPDFFPIAWLSRAFLIKSLNSSVVLMEVARNWPINIWNILVYSCREDAFDCK